MPAFAVGILLLLAILAAVSAPGWIPVLLDIVGRWEAGK